MKTLKLTLILICTSLGCFAQNTSVPDDNFEQALIDLGYDSGPLDNFVPTANINTVTYLNISNKNISHLIGIEDFTALERLYCSSNQLSSLDVSQNINLEVLQCSYNQLSSIDVSQNINLEVLQCNYNQLSSLDVSQNINLEVLRCSSNQLTSLSTNQNTNLTSLSCGINQLTNLNLSQNTDLIYLSCELNELTSLNLSQMTDLETLYCYRNQLTNLNISQSTNLSTLICRENELTNLDVSQNINLNLLDLGYNELTSLNVSVNTDLTQLSCNDNQLNSLDVTLNTDLIELNCNNNQIGSLDVSLNTELIELYCNNNQISSLNVSLNIDLTELNCDNNQLTDLDVSLNTDLILLDCSNNQLTTLNVKNGNNTNFTFFDSRVNSNLSCIEVNSPSYSSTNWTNIDNASSFVFNCHYDDTYIPDDNFEQALIDLGLDGSLNDYVTTANINTLTTLNLNNKNISDLTGIEDFIALTQLRCHTNNLTSIDISTLVSLSLLQCHTNNLTSLDTSNNLNLKQLFVHQNNLTNLDLSNNHLLTLSCNNNELISLDIRNGENADITNFNSTNNPDLTCIQVDDVGYSTINWTNIDATTSFSEDCHYDETYIPDDSFEQALIDLGYDSGTLDNYVTTANINTLTVLGVTGKNIEDLTGIEDFVALTTLYIQDNLLTNIDISQNTSLANLQCFDNLLVTLDVSQNTALRILLCYRNQLTNLDLSNNTDLTNLSCIDNDNLTSLNVQNGNNLNVTHFDAAFNENLYCIQVDDPVYSDANWSSIDNIASFSTNCHYGETYVPDDNFEQALIDLGYDSGALDNYVFPSDINSITSLNVNNKNIADLTGIEDFVSLTSLTCNTNNLSSLNISNSTGLTLLDCSDNNLDYLYLNNNTNLTSLSVSNNDFETLNVSNNTALTTLNIDGNNLTNLDLASNISLLDIEVSFNNLTLLGLGNNIALEKLICSNNSLTSLELSNNGALTYLSCSNNELTRLNVKNGNNTNVTFFDTNNNVDLTCIEVDDENYSTTNWTNIDPTISFSEDCLVPETYVADANFENYLETHNTSGNLVALGAVESMGNGVANDNYVFTDAINTVTELYLNNRDITDLTGIEDFISLTYINCNDNQLTSLDFSQNTALTYLSCYNNQLTNLDLSQNAALEALWCSNNQLTSLDISQNPVLDYIICSDNQLTSLDISQNPVLDDLLCSNNQLTSLNLKNGNNLNFNVLIATNNPNLTCIEVDNAVYSTTNWTDIDPVSSFSEDCGGNSIIISPKAFLQGPMLNPDVAGIMNDDLRSGNYIPTTSPYSDNATCNASVFTITGSDAIVDWIWLELRDANDNTLIIDSRSALLQRDGDVVDTDGTSNIIMSATPADYYVVVNHRNHLGAMSASTINLTDSSTTLVDFTTSNFLTYGSYAQAQLTPNTMALRAGNINGDNRVRYQGSGNDANYIKDDVLAHPNNGSGNNLFFYFAYDNADIDMDSRVRYQGSGNDANIIKDIVLAHPSNGALNNLFFFLQQLPNN